MKIDSLIESGTKELGVRFNLVGVLPSAMLFLFVLALHWSGAPGHSPDFRLAFEKIETFGIKEGVLIVLGVLVFSLVLQPLQLSLVRMLEGYWTVPLLPIVGTVLSYPGVAWHRFRRGKLELQTQVQRQPSAEELSIIAAADWRLRRYYPPRRNILPTALGNALRASEEVPQQKYHLDAVVVWPRLYALLPGSMLDLLADRRNQLDLAARLCATFILAATVAAAVLFKYGWWMAVPAGALLLAWLSYRGAIAAAIAYGESVQTVFDLYRFELYKALHLPLPTNLADERVINEMISDFFRQGLDASFKSLAYEKPKPPKDN